MKDPAQALAAARAAAAKRPPGGADPEQELWLLAQAPVSARHLAEWAMIEPEQAEVYSTRRFGKPITAFKRLLIRLLGQYLGQMSAQQSRFNAQVAAHVLRLEERVQTLEAQAHERRADAGDQPPA